MKSLFTASLLLTAACSLAIKQPKGKAPESSESVSFTENKGQVRDQFGKARPDVLFSGNAGNASFHITHKGISYQFFKSTPRVSAPEKNTDKESIEKEAEKTEPVTIYRFDQNWLNANTNPTLETEHDLPGFNNYYYEHCPNGALNVKTYKGIWLKNIYNNISVHYYEKKGVLKYDYEVAPHADYRNIQIEVKGAEISVQKDGSLLIKTPFGDLEEGTPEVYQNHKQLPAKWIVKNNCLSFDIENYNPALPLTIDPVVRSWGTYYGGSVSEDAYAVATDNAGNVYMAGRAGGSSGTIIATTGSHQATYGGSGLYDAFLVKFNESGTRLWGTFYGGSGADEGLACTTDVNGNVYIAGTSTSVSSNVIGTTGTHQATQGSNGSYVNGFLAKFNSNGQRQWGTYYGVTGSVWAYSCAVDASGNVFLSGLASADNGTFLATTGAYQATPLGSGNDLFLAKFNSSGVRLWGTYYGSSSNEFRGRCATDPSGNVYLLGTTAGAGAFATTGAHQTSFGGSYDAVLAKFSATGTRLWATYYGGTGSEDAYFCKTDANGNVYICGSTTSTNAMVTANAHQTTLGGNNDAFLASFNANGVRQWGTYYGGTGADYANAVDIDAAGNIHLAGITSSTVAIATSGSHQTVTGGGNDGFLVKFNSTYFRQWGTYYGGTGADVINSCATGPLGDVYIAGTTASTLNISSTGSHQVNYSANNDGFLARLIDCTGPASQPAAINGKTTVCANGINTYSVSPNSDGIYYSWSLPSGFTGSGTSNAISVTSGTASGIISLTVSNACGSSSPVSLSVTISGTTPTITVNSGSICIGGNFTLSAGGASTYTYSSGSPVVSPIFTSTYTVMGTNAAGCVSTVPATSTVVVNARPVITANNGILCAGATYTIVPSGGYAYTYSGGSNVVSPTTTTIYTITGSNQQGCTGTGTVSILVFQCVGVNEIDNVNTINVSPNPTTGNLNISSVGVEITSVLMYDNTGKLVLKKEGVSVNDLSLSEFANGIYLLEIYMNEQKVVRKIVKE